VIYLKQSTASQEVLLGPFVDSTDGVTAETALTIANTDIKIWVTGATTLANKNSGGGTHISNGNYYAVLDATDTATLGSGAIVVQVSGALAVRHDICILAANVYDSLIGGGDVLDVSTTQFNGSAVTAASGRPEVNTSHIAGSAVNTSSAQIGVNVVNAGGTAWASGSLTAAVFAADAITAAKVAADVGTEIGTAVWATAARTLTANTNLNDLSAAGVRAAVGLASANLDTQLTAIDDFIDTEVTAIKAVTDLLPDGGALTSLATAANLATVDTVVDAIKVKTDSLTFTTAGIVDANVQQINDVAITGNGQAGTEFGV
jgi:hypothetical protein